MDDVASFLAALRRRFDEGGAGRPALAVASVVRARGSTPRKPGAKMLVDPAGPQLGTIGGGCGEAEVLARAQRVLATGEASLIEVSLLEEDGWESSSICGGLLDVFIERIGAEVGGVPRGEFFGALDAARSDGRAAAIVTLTGAARGDVAARLVGRKCIVDDRGTQFFPFADDGVDELAVGAAVESLENSRPVDRAEDERRLRVFVEPVCEAPELVVVGAGHVGAALARLASHAGFVVTVIDDRPTFANPVRLPEAHAIRIGDPREILAALPARVDRYVVLVTRGHRLDADCLRVALDADLAYLGMIGSRRRVARIREWMLEQGASPERLARLHAPIGLDIGAETPAEIAVSILGEMVATRRRTAPVSPTSSAG
jgi:xanthine dehydrogenase accessory factor